MHPALHYLHLVIVICTIVLFTILKTIINWLPLPSNFLLFIYNHLTIIRKYFSKLDENKPTLVKSTIDLINEAGFECESHSIATVDHYILGLHRLSSKLYTKTTYELSNQQPLVTLGTHPLVQELDLHIPTPTGNIVQKHYRLPTLPKRNIRTNSHHRPPVLLMHGLMMSSESWVASGTDSLPYLLYKSGYDVWLGNFRGNRYSQKHLTYSITSSEYWNFSLDEVIRYDLPAIIQYILQYTNYNRLAFIGFSQGSAVCFGTLALFPHLQHSLSCLLSLSPAMALRGLSHSPVTTIVSTDTTFLYLLFGKKRMLRIALDIQRILSPSIWVSLIDLSLAYLFGWRTKNIDPIMKLSLYHHLFALTSVKTIVHWFHIIASQRFEMFAEYTNPTHGNITHVTSSTTSATIPLASMDIASSLRWFTSFRILQEHQIMPLYDTRIIKTPLALFVGGADTLIDIEKLLMVLPAYSGTLRIPKNQSSTILYQPLPGTKAIAVKATYQQYKQIRSLALSALALQKLRASSSESKTSIPKPSQKSLRRQELPVIQHHHSSTISSNFKTEELYDSSPNLANISTTTSNTVTMKTLRHKASAKLNRLRLPFTISHTEFQKYINQLNLEIDNHNYHIPTTVERDSTITNISSSSPKALSMISKSIHPHSSTKPITQDTSKPPSKLKKNPLNFSLHRSLTLPESALDAIAQLVRDEEQIPHTISTETNSYPSPIKKLNNPATPAFDSEFDNRNDENIMKPLPLSLSSSTSSLPSINAVHKRDSFPRQTPISSSTFQNHHDNDYVYEQHAPFIFQEPTYEHLDYLWATTVKDRAFPAIVLLLDKYRFRQHYQTNHTHNSDEDSP